MPSIPLCIGNLKKHLLPSEHNIPFLGTGYCSVLTVINVFKLPIHNRVDSIKKNLKKMPVQYMFVLQGDPRSPKFSEDKL
jgi:hypothetical protein